MTRKEINKFLANTKVYVNGKSKEIQEKLFSLGYQWADGESTVQQTDAPFLFIYSNKSITFIDNMNYFVHHENREITAKQILSLELTEPSYRPFKNAEECWQEMLKHEPFGWIKRIDTGCFANIAMISDYGIMFRDGQKYFYDYNITLKKYTFADSTPFGIKK